MILSSCNFEDKPPINGMEYVSVEQEQYLKGTDEKVVYYGGQLLPHEIREHFSKQNMKFSKQIERKYELNVMPANADDIVLAEPFVLIMTDSPIPAGYKLATLKGLPMAKTLKAAQTLIFIQYNDDSPSQVDFHMNISDTTGFPIKDPPGYVDYNKDRKKLYVEIEKALLNLKYAPREKSTPGQYYKFMEMLGEANGFDKLKAMLNENFRGAKNISEVFPDLKKEDIRAFIMPKNYKHLIQGVKGNWKLTTPGSLFIEENIKIFYNPASSKESNYIICAYMESYSYHATYSNGAIGYSTMSVARLINVNTGKTEAILRKKLDPPQTVNYTIGFGVPDQRIYWETLDDVTNALF